MSSPDILRKVETNQPLTPWKNWLFGLSSLETFLDPRVVASIGNDQKRIEMVQNSITCLIEGCREVQKDPSLPDGQKNYTGLQTLKVVNNLGTFINETNVKSFQGFLKVLMERLRPYLQERHDQLQAEWENSLYLFSAMVNLGDTEGMAPVEQLEKLSQTLACNDDDKSKIISAWAHKIANRTNYVEIVMYFAKSRQGRSSMEIASLFPPEIE